MSLAIDVERVQRVLLAHGWHLVESVRLDGGDRASTFRIDSYEFVEGRARPGGEVSVLLGGGQEALITTRGFSFHEVQGGFFCGPLTSVLAVELRD